MTKLFANFSIKRSAIHVAFTVAILLAYGSYAVNFAVYRSSLFWGLGGVIALTAALGAALDRRWAKPIIWSLGLIISLEWVVFTFAAYRSGYFHPASVLTATIALAPGVCMCALTGYCCYVANIYIGGYR